MLEVTHGRAKNQLVANEVRSQLLKMDLDGSLYIGYPVLATADESVTVDALLVTHQHGLVAFLFDEIPPSSKSTEDTWHRRENQQNKLFGAVETNLGRHQSLRPVRRLGIDIQTVTVVPDEGSAPHGLVGAYCNISSIPSVVEKFAPMEERLFVPLQAALQRVSTIKAPKRRGNIGLTDSKGIHD